MDEVPNIAKDKVNQEFNNFKKTCIPLLKDNLEKGFNADAVVPHIKSLDELSYLTTYENLWRDLITKRMEAFEKDIENQFKNALTKETNKIKTKASETKGRIDTLATLIKENADKQKKLLEEIRKFKEQLEQLKGECCTGKKQEEVKKNIESKESALQQLTKDATDNQLKLVEETEVYQKLVVSTPELSRELEEIQLIVKEARRVTYEIRNEAMNTFDNFMNEYGTMFTMVSFFGNPLAGYSNQHQNQIRQMELERDIALRFGDKEGARELERQIQRLSRYRSMCTIF